MYSLSPDRYKRRVTSTVRVIGAVSSPSSACSPSSMSAAFMTSLSRSRTSAAPVGFRASLPLKMTSSILSPRRLLALCSPITHVMASATLLLPHPLGPTMAVTPLSKASSERSEKDLKPLISKRSRRMAYTTASRRDAPKGWNCWLEDSLATDRIQRPFRLLTSESGPGPENGRQCNKGYLLGQAQSGAQ